MRKCRKQGSSSFDRAKRIITEQGEISDKTAEAILRGAMSVLKDEQSRYNRSADEQRFTAAKKLLEHYNELRISISSSVSNTIDVIDDSDIERLMQREDSIKNLQVRSLAMQVAKNRVMFLNINSALDEMRTVCQNDRSPRFRRQYDVLYSRYVRGWAPEAICTELHIERTTYFRTIEEAIDTFATILFGTSSPEIDNITSSKKADVQTVKKDSETTEQLKFF